MKKTCRTAFAMACVAFLMPGCASQLKSAHRMRAADEAAIRQADIAWAKASAAMDFEGMVSYYADDATLLLPHMPKARGTKVIRKALRPLFDAPGFSLRWQLAEVEVARSGDMGYVVGTYEMTMNDSEGHPTTDYGSYVEVWKKQPNGAWKCIVDMINSDVPLPANN